jgi:hypothetical protein
VDPGKRKTSYSSGVALSDGSGSNKKSYKRETRRFYLLVGQSGEQEAVIAFFNVLIASNFRHFSHFSPL